MPLSKYNREFGGKPGSAAKAHAAMVDEYGPDKGERVFYATKNKRKSNLAAGHKQMSGRQAARALGKGCCPKGGGGSSDMDADD